MGRGEIFGLLGPNGAGKTTVLRSALGLLRPTRGRLLLFGDPVIPHKDRHHERLGYLPADLRLWPSLTARRTSDLMLGLGARRPDRRRRDELARRLDLELDRPIKGLSLGNRQKVGLLLALQHDPDLIILDEPTSGLDPLMRRVAMTLLTEAVQRGATVIYSSHNLSEVEQICSRVGILRRGRLAALKTIGEIRAERLQRLQFVLAPHCDPPNGLPPGLAERFRLDRLAGRTFEVRYQGSPDSLLLWLASLSILEITSPQISLEEAFLAYYREDLGAGEAEFPLEGGPN